MFVAGTFQKTIHAFVGKVYWLRFLLLVKTMPTNVLNAAAFSWEFFLGKFWLSISGDDTVFHVERGTKLKK